MASRWRRRPLCILVAEVAAPAALREISAAGAFVETNARPLLGTTITLSHPEAGTIRGEVAALAQDGIALRFARDGAAAGFALAAILSDMSCR